MYCVFDDSTLRLWDWGGWWGGACFCTSNCDLFKSQLGPWFSLGWVCISYYMYIIYWMCTSGTCIYRVEIGIILYIPLFSESKGIVWGGWCKWWWDFVIWWVPRSVWEGQEEVPSGWGGTGSSWQRYQKVRELLDYDFRSNYIFM